MIGRSFRPKRAASVSRPSARIEREIGDQTVKEPVSWAAPEKLTHFASHCAMSDFDDSSIVGSA
jgi:hypothetical protein